MTHGTHNPAVDISPVDTARTQTIKDGVRAISTDFRMRHSWTRHQNLIGLSILLFSALGMLGTGWLYIEGLIAWYICIPIAALFASLAHEIEHDLIHRLYFRKRLIPHNFMMLVCWLMRGSTINPWIRRHLHLKHHKVSGSRMDTEERSITNGETFGLRRLFMMTDSMIATPLLREGLSFKRRMILLLRTLIGFFPIGTVHGMLWYSFLIIHLSTAVAALFSASIAWPNWVNEWLPIINIAVIVWVAPNVLRSFCLHFVSSNMHYFGDVQPGNIHQQTQVLTPKWMIPFQLFCFNFGGTHAIHHFVVNDPFYIRQLTAKSAYPVLRDQGVRFNDTDTFRRANRYVQN